MTEDLQQLLDKIRREGIEKAEAEAEAIIAKAKAEAEAISSKAAADAAALRVAAERDAKSFERRAEESIRQAARDLKLQVAAELRGMVEKLLAEKVTEAMSDSSAVKAWADRAIKAYIERGDEGVEAELGGEGNNIVGFVLKAEAGRVERSFTDEAVTEALAKLIRPRLRELLQ